MSLIDGMGVSLGRGIKNFSVLNFFYKSDIAIQQNISDSTKHIHIVSIVSLSYKLYMK